MTLGHESMTGQINVSLRDADIEDKFIVNGFLNQVGRYELNTVSRHAISRKWRSALLTHGEWADRINDRNTMTPRTMPCPRTSSSVPVAVYGRPRFEGEYTVTAVSQEKEAGQLPLLDAGQGGLWMADKTIDRLVATAKTGMSFLETRAQPRQSIDGGEPDQTLSFGPYRFTRQQFARLPATR